MPISSPFPGLIVTGTDTGVGKTYVCRILAETFAPLFPVTYFKPVHTGCPADEPAPDFAYVRLSGVLRLLADGDHVPYTFADACSPHLAAQRAGAAISIDLITDRFRRLADTGAMVIVEGAGGVLVPVNATESMLDIMVRLSLPVVLVASPRLGTLNHTLLSAGAVRDADLRLAGVIVNNAAGTPRDFIHADNIATLREKLRPVPVIDLDYRAGDRSSIEEFCRAITQ